MKKKDTIQKKEKVKEELIKLDTALEKLDEEIINLRVKIQELLWNFSNSPKPQKTILDSPLFTAYIKNVDKKQKAEFSELISETVTGVIKEVIIPPMEKMHADIKNIKQRLIKVENGLTRVESEVLDLKHEVKGLRNAETNQDVQLSDHEARITALEAV